MKHGRPEVGDLVKVNAPGTAWHEHVGKVRAVPTNPYPKAFRRIKSHVYLVRMPMGRPAGFMLTELTVISAIDRLAELVERPS